MSDVKPFVLDFDLVSGFCTSGKVKPTQRRVSDMVAQFANEAAARAMVEGGDPLLYEFYGLDLPEDDSGVLQFGTTILYPGKVGEEYFMTKGHFHTILDTSEIYYGLSGRGMMLMETPEGQVDWKEIGPGEALYVPRPLGPPKHQHRHRASGDVLRLPGGRRPRLRHHRGEGLPEAGGGAGRKARRHRQPQMEGVAPPFAAVMFDLDGVLRNTEPYHRMAYATAGPQPGPGRAPGRRRDRG